MATAQEMSPVSFGYYVPKPPLSEFIEVLWYWKGHDVLYSQERILPIGVADLVIRIQSGRTSESGISGPKAQSVLIERRDQDEFLGVHFKIGGTFPFLGFPSDKLYNVDITLADLWGESKTGQLLNLLHDARTMDSKFRVLERWFTLEARRPLKHHPAVSFAVEELRRAAGALSSREIAEQVGLSQRRFIQIFREEVGLTPKLLCRLLRFQGVIRAIQSRRGMEERNGIDWVDLALVCGYFDQPHFIHEFQEFSGLTPGEYLSLRTENARHVQVR
jgi:AraC-like DNA-binding protein